KVAGNKKKLILQIKKLSNQFIGQGYNFMYNAHIKIFGHFVLFKLFYHVILIVLPYL
ncbi:hypothetical protein ACJX0J_022371, partial [Zea mays]